MSFYQLKAPVQLCLTPPQWSSNTNGLNPLRLTLHPLPLSLKGRGEACLPVDRGEEWESSCTHSINSRFGSIDIMSKS